MPELAEVEYYRKRWNCGIGARVVAVKLHADKRVFRGMPVRALKTQLTGSVMSGSAAHGKQILFNFSPGAWLGVHLGMTGELAVGPPNLTPDKHDHLVLYQEQRSLIFRDPRQFGRVRFGVGQSPPDWWAGLPPAVTSAEFRPIVMMEFLKRHRKLPVKAALLLQAGFPGIGNWMADEVLWRSKIHPSTPVGLLAESQITDLWRNLRFVCRHALRHVGADFSDPPAGWLFHERWQQQGRCPIHKGVLERHTIGGRTTRWCAICQSGNKSSAAPREPR